jgi:hypothetical protein
MKTFKAKKIINKLLYKKGIKKIIYLKKRKTYLYNLY